MAAMPPMVTLVPTSTGGQITDILVSVIVFSLTSAALGIAASTGMVMQLSEFIPKGIHGLVLTVLTIPFTLVLMSLILALFLARLEGWDVWTSFLFMISMLCGLGDPLTPVTPSTDKANFFVLLCSVIELSLGGAMIGIIGGHPKVTHFLAYVEGNLESESKEVIGESGICDSNKPASLTEESKRQEQENNALRAQVKILQSRLAEAGLHSALDVPVLITV